MQPFEEIKRYSKTVCEQIRWKKAHHMISKEIENHLCDQRDAYILQGEEEKAATQKAILQMGDAVSIGMELDQAYKPRPQWTMMILTIVLMIIGVIANYIMDTSEYSLSNFNIFPFIFAFTCFLITYFLDFWVLGKYSKYCYFIVLFTSILGLFFSTTVNGRAWLFTNIFSISLAYLSLIFPLVYSLLIYSLKNKGYKGIILCGIGYIPFAVILMFVPTIMGLLLFTISALILLCTTIKKGWFGVNKKQGLLLVLIPTLICAIVLFCYLLQNAYFLGRLISAINPYSDPKGSGYITCLIRDLLSNARFIGKGAIPPQYGENIHDLPIFNSDYILVILTHYFGWIVSLGIIFIFIVFSALGVYYIFKQKSVLGFLVAASIMLTFILQSVFYIANNFGYGIFFSCSLPLVSYGKKALLINSALIGFMLSVFRTGNIYQDNIKTPIKNNVMFTYEDGKIIINLKG